MDPTSLPHADAEGSRP